MATVRQISILLGTGDRQIRKAIAELKAQGLELDFAKLKRVGTEDYTQESVELIAEHLGLSLDDQPKTVKAEVVIDYQDEYNYGYGVMSGDRSNVVKAVDYSNEEAIESALDVASAAKSSLAANFNQMRLNTLNRVVNQAKADAANTARAYQATFSSELSKALQDGGEAKSFLD